MAVVSDAEIGLHPIARTDFVREFVSRISPITDTEYVPLAECNGRVLAEDIYSKYNIPSGRTAGGDSVVMRWSAFENGMPTDEEMATWREGVDWARADMGDDFADIFDCATHVEGVEFLDDGGIRFLDDPPHVSGPESIKMPGSTTAVGDKILEAGTVLTPTTMALVASVGHVIIPVRRRVRVAFIPTGSELIVAGEVMQRGKTADSNSFMIRQLILNAGAEPIMFPITVDTKESLEQALIEARKTADLVLINGGSSKGSEDFNAQLLSEGASYYQHGVLLRPARVVAASVIDGKPHVNLPGPTMAAHVVWQWLVRYAIAQLQGLPAPEHTRVKAVVAEQAGPSGHPGPQGAGKPGKDKPRGGGPKMDPREEFMSFFTVCFEDGRYVAHPANHKSGPAGMMLCNALYIQPKMSPLPAGTEIEVELL